MPPSSSGSGHLSFKEAAGIRLPLGVGYYERKLIVDYIITKPGLILPGSMPERLMGADCKFVGNMSTLVQIQLGPIIHRSAIKWYKPFVVLQKCSIPIEKKSKFLIKISDQIFWYWYILSLPLSLFIYYISFFQQVFFILLKI